jgi:putative acetyltransferase
VIEVREGDLGDPQVEALLVHHRTESRASTPAENAHSMDPAALAAAADITIFSAWDSVTLLGVCALREIDAMHGELKSMRTHPAHLRKGVGRAMLDHIVAVARQRGYRRISLETGTAPMFGPSNTMYDNYGFTDGPAFGGYPPSPHNRFMTLQL